MTEYELVDSTAVMAIGAMGALALYLIVLTAYMVAIYFVGAKLSKSETGIITGVFAVAATIFTYVTAGFFIRQMYFAKRVAEIQTDAFLPVGGGFPILIVFVELVGIFAGLKLMWDVRKRKIV